MAIPHIQNPAILTDRLKEINAAVKDGEKIKEIVHYLEEVTTFFAGYYDTIHSLILENEELRKTADTHQKHLNSHDLHLDAHNQHLGSHDQHLKTHDEQLNNTV
ncbi:MAG: hypothetical protein HYZ42_02435 [Bacteroidetes bacterium]|nr:hypothetical protein [Bacteroidota bacterium]